MTGKYSRKLKNEIFGRLNKFIFINILMFKNIIVYTLNWENIWNLEILKYI